ncbi:type VI secretion system membrane subunit TssM [Aestuariibius sp. 2305UL40-4]|uniref:type VI secretion system membrane subunit TssM n=1 Tax=Aestuariibius violaceus TaxID=3234132 RepID=UPI003490C295
MRIRLPRPRYKSWMRWPLIVIGLICLGVAIWFGGEMIGGVFASLWLRLTVLGVLYGILLVVFLIRWRKRRKKAAELEEAMIPQVVEGDAKELSERMTKALATLKKSGGASYLYDLPWYVIIGPPGAGKTTALENSGLEFPLANKDEGGVIEGFGGTRYTDWWFSEEAVLIDTAGRYTTQDSDAEADSKSWTAFLELLKKARSDQPINGIILAFSVEDMLNSNEAELTRHAEIVRERLGEIHETLRVDFPVYVVFTKCDLISGFREYFSSFSLNRRKNVWGVTFQTKDRKEQTYDKVPQEFDQLVSRLSDEIIDRMNEEPDGISRIAIFGLPGQMALLRDNVSDFLQRVFEPTRYKTNAILRGFYFTSGTQEGTPIDQVLGAMSRGNEGGAFTPAFMSGKGKSYFLHDLLRRVIFEERDWVSFDKKAVARRQILRAAAMGVIGVVTLGLLTAFGISYWQNATLLARAEGERQTYQNVARFEIQREVVSDTDLRAILPYLNSLRSMPAGYGDPEDGDLWEGFGLGQRNRVNAAATEAYSDALEKMLRPRLILDVEQRIPLFLQDNDLPQIYRALKVYMLLGGIGGRSDDEAIQVWFEEQWRRGEFASLSDLDEREALVGHLEAMLSLDDTRSVEIGLDPETIARARDAIIRMPLVDQAYITIADAAETNGMPDWSLEEATGRGSDLVFITRDGSDLSDVTVPSIYTFMGFWDYFYPALDEAEQRLRDDQWVLGEAAGEVDYEGQLATLTSTLLTKYRSEFIVAWDEMFERVELASVSADAPSYAVLEELASGLTSPLYALAREVTRETRLSRLIDEMASLDQEAIMSGNLDGVTDEASRRLLQRFITSQGGTARIFLESAANNSSGKNQQRVGGASQSQSPLLPIERLEDDFELWHIMMEGEQGERAINELVADIQGIHQNRLLSRSNPTQAALELPGVLSTLENKESRTPPPIDRFIREILEDLRSESRDATIDQMNRALTNDVTSLCRSGIETSYPFTQNERHLSLSEFGRFFGERGVMDRYYSEYLESHAQRIGDGQIAPDPRSRLSQELSQTTLDQFGRAAAIRNAFFPPGSSEPRVSITVRPELQPGMSVGVTIGDKNHLFNGSGPGVQFDWPNGSGNVTLEIYNRGGAGGGQRDFTRNGPWSIIDFLNAGTQQRRDGNVLSSIYTVQGLSVRIEMQFNSAQVPFLMDAIDDFRCPTQVN